VAGGADRRLTWWRQARAIALLPGVAAVVVPGLILLLGEAPDPGWGLGGPVSVLPALAGLALIVAGLAMWAWTVRLFTRVGKGTLAPWDPTRKLVVEGPYRHVRNPMISAVLAVLLGEAALLGSIGIAVWTAAFAGINTAYFVLSEEPGLERRFGEEYRAYKRHVPRWLPRRTAWAPGSRAATSEID
jgi:protein-S-isoprenylcysteine O-methyltransferase Ste14